MKNRGQIAIRVAVTVILGLFSLPALMLGLYFFTCRLRISANVYYVEYPYLAAAIGFIAVGAFGLFCSSYGAWRRSFYGFLFAIPVVMGLAVMVYIPDGTPHLQRSLIADTNYLSGINSSVRAWYELHRRFPSSESEFQEALRIGALEYRREPLSLQSFYSQRGVRLRYQLVVVSDASGPRLDNVSERPGVIYYCVSGDQQEFWVTMTGLRDDVAPAASLKRVADIAREKVSIVGAARKDYSLPVR